MPKAKRTVKITARPKAIVRCSRQLQPPSLPEKIEQALIEGNLANLSAAERVDLYQATCRSLGLNSLTHPFAYILFEDNDGKEKMQLYALRAATDQLRSLHKVSVLSIKRWKEDGFLKAEAIVRDWEGRSESAIGVIPLKQYSKKYRKWYDLEGRQLANAFMHVETKAKRRATLSLCGLGMLDESELDTMRVLGGATQDGRIFRYREVPVLEDNLERAVEVKDASNPYLKSFEEREKEQLAALDTRISLETVPPPNAKEKTDATPQKPAKDARIAPNSEVRTPKSHEDGLASPDGGKPAAKPSARRDARPAPAEYGAKGDAPRHDRVPGPPRADIPGDLFTVKGQLIRVVSRVSKKKSNYRRVEISNVGRDSATYFCFDNKERMIDGDTKDSTFSLLDQAKTGVPISFLCRGRMVQGKPMPELVTLLRISNLEWELDGTPIIQRGLSMREPGEDVE